MGNFLQIIQIIVTLTMSTLILLQGSGAGLSSPFGGGGETFKTRRGFEKVLFNSTIVLGVVFALTLLARFFL